ncbi:MAG TPA: serine/threonine-protein kinase [Kofleriaceae bacterium]|jgi:serine/threonine-protein kinase
MADDDTPLMEPPDPQAATQPGQREAKTISDTQTPSAVTLVPAGSVAAALVSLPPPGYELGVQIGRGGMGEVIAAHDNRIGREVAVKRMVQERPTNEATTRFLREARIQARLEHPSIVPVHELGVDAHGRLYFTMKRLAGRTFGQRLQDGIPLLRALRAFVEVCKAVEFSHARGVVHRDLKPSNIMMGDYGEVYVIDWGIARVLGDDTESSTRITQTDIVTLDDGSTKEGALLGTPGYMSPEQLRGLSATPKADIYALGSIMFEIVAGEPLHPRGEGGIASTLADPQQRPSVRHPERSVAPELDDLVFAALEEQQENRPSAAELAEKLEMYLDGDRDLAQRKALATRALAVAMTAFESNDPEQRKTAIQHAGQALALDHTNVAAAQLVTALTLEPPKTMPAELEKGLADMEIELAKERSGQAQRSYLALFMLIPATLFLEIKNWGLVIGFYGLVMIALMITQVFKKTGRPSPAVVLGVNLAIVVMFSRIAGPFILTPLFVCGVLLASVSIPWIAERMWVVVGWAALAVIAPLIVEQLTSLQTTVLGRDGGIQIHSNVIAEGGPVAAGTLIVASVLLTVALSLYILTIIRRRREAQNQLFVTAWHLRQLLPTTKR